MRRFRHCSKRRRRNDRRMRDRMRDGRKAESIASVSGFATRGVSADFVRLLVAEHELFWQSTSFGPARGS
jgi:hypothetical protein